MLCRLLRRVNWRIFLVVGCCLLAEKEESSSHASATTRPITAHRHTHARQIQFNRSWTAELLLDPSRSRWSDGSRVSRRSQSYGRRCSARLDCISCRTLSWCMRQCPVRWDGRGKRRKKLWEISGNCQSFMRRLTTIRRASAVRLRHIGHRGELWMMEKCMLRLARSQVVYFQYFHSSESIFHSTSERSNERIKLLLTFWKNGN